MLKKIKYNSPVVLTFAALSLLSLILGSVSGGATTEKLFRVYRAPLTDPLTYLRFFLHVLGHSNYSHYISNMLLLLVIGPQLEDRFSSSSLLWSIIATALVSGLVQFVFFPHTALLGASGIVFMMIIMSTFLVYKKGTLPLTMILVFILYIGGEIANGIFQNDNISQLAHAIGGICGGIFGFLLVSRKHA
ncbi:MAG: rhomboid family intramembrane serine protease [Oscillospiraceae bacterium]|nr:rhomboid family intramembrane serine protease [Oscillospiraceae bacterium]